MKSFIIILSCIILLVILFDKSGAFLVGSKIVRDGAVNIEKTSWEWHPEKIGPYLEVFYSKWANRFFKPVVSVSTKKAKKTHKPVDRLILKNGTALLGNVIRKDENGILFRSDEGDIFFGHDEILSIE